LTAQMSKPAMNIAIRMTGSIAHRRGYPSAPAAVSALVATTAVPAAVCAVGMRAVTIQPPKFDPHQSSISIKLYDRYRTSRKLGLCSKT
jgi:hypothetical protein